jgi:hypothetical protein
MFKSIKIGGGSFANFGKPQVQSVVTDTAYLLSQNNKQTSPIANFTPTHELPAGINVIDASEGNLTVYKDYSLSEISNSLFDNRHFVIPSFSNRNSVNQILPTYALHLQPKNVSDINHHSSEKFLDSARKFQPYEILTGISQERPEIIMLSEFLPLFNNDNGKFYSSGFQNVENNGFNTYLTSAGQLLNSHVQSRDLRQVGMISQIHALRSRFKNVEKKCTDNHQLLDKGFDDLSVDVNFLLEFIRSKETLKRQFDIRDSLHITHSEKVAQKHTSFVRAGQDSDNRNSMGDLVTRVLPITYTPSDVLSRFGYLNTSIENVYSSTKIWLQSLQELKDILRYHSLEFLDIVPNAQRRDQNGSTIVKNNPRDFFTFDKQLTSLIHVKDFFNVASDQIDSVLSSVSDTWKILYRNVHISKPEIHIAALVNLISKEYRYSNGLIDPTTKRILSEYYSYQIRPDGNIELFDNVIGSIGNSTFDIPSTRTNSLANLSLLQPAQNVEVALFETNYVNASNGALTPGGTYFVDSVLNDSDGQKFNTTRLDDLASLLNQSFTQINNIVQGMNLTGLGHSLNLDSANRKHANIVENPHDLIKTLLNLFVDLNTGKTQPAIKHDALSSVFALASTDHNVKTLLFMIVMLKISRSFNKTSQNSLNSGRKVLTSDNTPTLDILIAKLLTAITASVQNSTTSNAKRQKRVLRMANEPKEESTELLSSAITTIFRSNTPPALLAFVEALMYNISSAFDEINTPDGFTQYSHVSDTAVMMALFDLLVQLIAKYSNQSFVGLKQDLRSGLAFNIATTTTNNKESANFLISRIDKENSIVMQTIFSVFNSLDFLKKSIQGFSNFLNSPSSIKTLQRISSILNDNDMLKMLISEQQIYVLASTIQDLSDNIKKSSAKSNFEDNDRDGDVDYDDVIKIIDDSIISPKIKNALFGLFGSPEFASKKGNNKKILSVGVPLGFLHRLQQIARQQKHPNNKQTDIIQLVVYKIDVQNSDITFKPQCFLFEMSRFVPRNDSLYLQIPDNSSLNDVIHAIPTRDFGQKVDSNRSPEYFSTKPGGVSPNHKIAMQSKDYSFLSQQQKAEIVRNHVVSYLLEVYTKLLTGIVLGDHDFDLIDHPRSMSDDFVKLIAEHKISQTIELTSQKTQEKNSQSVSSGVLFSKSHVSESRDALRLNGSKQTSDLKRANSSGVAGSIDNHVQFGAIRRADNSKTATLQQQRGANNQLDLGKISHRNATIVTHDLKTVSNISHSLTTLSDVNAITKRLLTPKQFDRVFNVIIDPDDFEIDYDQTVKTEIGKASLEQLLIKGDIIAATENQTASSYLKIGDLKVPKNARPFVQNRLPRESNKYYFRNRDKNEGDLTIEKYFVTLETFEEGGNV